MHIIRSKRELKFFINADYMMNRGYFKPNFIRTLYEFISPDYIMNYIVSLRKTNYYRYGGGNIFHRFFALYYQTRVNRLGCKLGFSISERVFDYGLVIPHWGTIVVGGNNDIGKYAVLHTSICITHCDKNIGDYLYVSTGSIITGKVRLGNGITIAANTLVNKPFSKQEVLLIGNPAFVKKDLQSWIYSDKRYRERVLKIEEMRMNTKI